MRLKIVITAYTDLPDGMAFKASTTSLQKGAQHMAALAFNKKVPLELALLAGLIAAGAFRVELYDGEIPRISNPQNN